MRRSHRHVPTIATAAAAAGRLRRRRTCPLAIWRTVPRALIEPSHVADLSRILATTAILHERRWRAATAGDAAMSAAIAIDHLRRRSVGTRLADLVMSNLVVRAMEGDHTAPVILTHALMAAARLNPSDPGPARLVAGWLGAPCRPVPSPSRRHRSR